MNKIKKRRIFSLCIVIIVLFASFIVFKWDTIFQRGNPIPYLSAAIKLSEDNTFAAIENEEGIYITKRNENQSLFQMIQDTYNVEYKEQMGSGYIFSDGEKNYMVISEIYWSRYNVWTLDFNDDGIQ